MTSKNMFLLLATASFLIFSSCKKRYVCVCEGGLTGDYYYDETLTGMKKKEARAQCQAMGQPVNTPDGIFCDLK